MLLGGPDDCLEVELVDMFLGERETLAEQVEMEVEVAEEAEAVEAVEAVEVEVEGEVQAEVVVKLVSYG